MCYQYQPMLKKTKKTIKQNAEKDAWGGLELLSFQVIVSMHCSHLRQ